MERDCKQALLAWRASPSRKPLLVRGARQVGKTTSIREFGATHFEDVVEINLELQREYHDCFKTLYPKEILQKIAILSHKKIIPGKTLLFIDEIQECPEAILALRYFYEKMPELHVLTAGSLLEFTLRKSEFRMPVGRVQSLYMYPLSFKEYLAENQEGPLLDYVANLNLDDEVVPAFHERLVDYVRQYMAIGGMPEVVSAYLARKDIQECQMIQNTLFEGYRSDLGKYDSQTNVRYLQGVYDKSPGLVGQHFKYVNIDREWSSRDIKPAVADLVDAGIITKIQSTAASGLPLASTVYEKKFKIVFVDVGLVSQAAGVSADILMEKNVILVNRGSIAEQFVGQELLAYEQPYKKANLYYWERGKGTSTAELDYITSVGSLVVPIEVKAGATGSLRSLQLFLNEKHLEFGVRISQRPLSFKRRVLSIPIYMIWELPRLVEAAISQGRSDRGSD